jgi:hypothetical protein
MPWEFAELPSRKKAGLIGMIKVRLEKEKKLQQEKKSGKKGRKGRRR